MLTVWSCSTEYATTMELLGLPSSSYSLTG